MSIYADLVCTRCNVSMWLGKVIHDNHNPVYFHIGRADEPPHWARAQLNAVLWKMLADHARHPLKVVVEGDPDYEPADGRTDIGGDAFDDVSFEDYLNGWPGLQADASSQAVHMAKPTDETDERRRDTST